MSLLTQVLEMANGLDACEREGLVKLKQAYEQQQAKKSGEEGAAKAAEAMNKVEVKVKDEAELKDLFETFDGESRGYMTKEAFRDFYDSMGGVRLPEEEAEMEVLLGNCNSLGEDKLSFEEFAKLMITTKNA